jgi:hypothetical protein
MPRFISKAVLRTSIAWYLDQYKLELVNQCQETVNLSVGLFITCFPIINCTYRL